MHTMRAHRLIAIVVGIVLVASGCSRIHVFVLASDAFDGRQNNTPGSVLAQDYIIDILQLLGVEAMDGTTDDAAYLDPIIGGNNVIGRIPGTDLAGEYVIVGAHYDHLGSCDVQGGDLICNGATDNATGVAIGLEIARLLNADAVPPRRTVIFAFWDREEDGLRGSAEWVTANGAITANTVAYLNYDIQAANLSPSLRSDTLAVAPSSGGAAMTTAVTSAANGSTLTVGQLSAVFGQGRSDYQNFLNVSVPTVFFTDATGPCYHTTLDDPDIAVDYAKLTAQVTIGAALARDMASTNSPPSFVAGLPAATYDDAVVISTLVNQSQPDWGRFTASQQTQLATIQSGLNAIVADGAAAFGADDIGTLLANSATLVTILESGACDGFLTP